MAPVATQPVPVPIPVNGINGTGPATPAQSLSSFGPAGQSLTEYSSNPFPNQHRRPKTNDIVPKQYLQDDGHPDYLSLILSAKVHEVCKETPLTHAVNLSNRLECRVLLKREDEQPVFSFKLRGAYNKMRHLDPDVSWRGVICCSAGNHAQGVAYSARKLKIPATIIMPEGTPSIKHTNVARMGGHVVLHGADFDAAKEECHRRERTDGLINIHPFDDPYVIAGQGTIGMELLRQTDISKVEAVFCCVGGGGLIAGVGVFLKRVAPHVKVIGVEAYDANAMYQSLKKGRRVVLDEVGLFADGAAVKVVGEENFRICKQVVDEVIQVSTDEACASMKDFYEDTRSIVEPAGALSIAGIKKYVAGNPSRDGQRGMVAITSGANMNFDRLRFVSQRATLGEGKEVLLRVSIPERPGSFSELIQTILPHAVTEFAYRYSSSEIANVLMGLSLAGPAKDRCSELETLMDRITAGGMMVKDLSGNEFSKSSLRCLIGGRSAVPNERVYMFKFPERPGALVRFLTTLRPKYNISMFQYRNEGSDMSTVTAGMLCPEGEAAELEKYLWEIGYPYVDCTDEEEFHIFLRE